MTHVNFRAALAVFVLLAPAAVAAHCPLEATRDAPVIPTHPLTDYEQLKAVEEAVRDYLATATAKLRRCEKRYDGFVYNIAVAELQETAERYNRLRAEYASSLGNSQ